MRKEHYLLIGLIAIFAAGAAYFIANARSELTINDLEARLSALESQITLQPSSENRSRIVTPFQGSSNYEQEMSRDRLQQDRVNELSRSQLEQEMSRDRLQQDRVNELSRSQLEQEMSRDRLQQDRVNELSRSQLEQEMSRDRLQQDRLNRQSQYIWP